jgi:hypothetical protein
MQYVIYKTLELRIESNSMVNWGFEAQELQQKLAIGF